MCEHLFIINSFLFVEGPLQFSALGVQFVSALPNSEEVLHVPVALAFDCLSHRRVKVLCCLCIFLVLILDVGYIVVAYPGSLRIRTFIKHVACFGQINYCEGVRLRHEVVVLELLRRYQIFELIVE